jgi:hypothetical protein
MEKIELTNNSILSNFNCIQQLKQNQQIREAKILEGEIKQKSYT